MRLVGALLAAGLAISCSYIPLGPPPTTPQASPSSILIDPVIGPVAGVP